MTTTFTVQNIKCGGCAKTISDKLSALEGIDSVHINEETGEVRFQHQNKDRIDGVREALTHMGYPLHDASNGLLTKARSFVSCAAGRMSAK